MMMFDSTRPRIPVHADRFDVLLEVVAAVVLLYAVVHLAVSYGQLPDRIPIHFSASGQPDGWAAPSSLVLLTGVQVFLYAMLTGIGFMPPWWYNIPWKITEENAERQYRLVRRMLRMMKVFILLLFLSLQEMIIAIAMRGTGQLPVWFLPVFLGLIFGTVGWYLVRGWHLR